MKSKTSTQTTTTIKNPLALHSFEERGAAIAQKVERIKTNPNYQKLSPEDQHRVISGVYHKYVVPAYKGAGYAIPSHSTWVSGASSISSVGGRSTDKLFADKGARAFAEDAIIGGTKALDEIGMFGIKMNRKAYMAMHGLENHFAAPILNAMGYQLKPGQYEAEKANERHAQALQQNIQNSDYLLESHPRKGFINNLGSTAGEFLVQLPIYEAVGAGRALVGIAGKGVFDGLPLTQKLAASPIGKFAAKRIGEATDGFLSSLVTSGGNKSEAVSGAVGFAALGALGEGAGKAIKIAAAPLIKKWTANTVAMGGIPFAQEIADSVMSQEMSHEVVAQHSGMQVVDFGHGISIHPESEEKGKFVFNDPVDGKAKEFPYSNKADRQQVYNNLQDIADTVRSKHDPILHTMEKGERASLNSLAIQKYGKPLRGISHAQREVVRNMRYDTIQQAAQEAPVHLPDLTKLEHEDTIQTQIKESPQFAQNAKVLEQLGIKLSDVTTNNEIEKVSIDTGIKNSPTTQAKLGKSRNETISSLEKKRMEKGISINAIQFSKDISDSIAYFRAPKNRIKFDGAVGSRAIENFNNFYELLREADGDKIHFENPYHRLLYHYKNRSELPDAVSKKLLYELRKIEPGKPATEIAKEADWFNIHLNQMARSGRLITEGNIFNSTKTNVGSMRGWTPWQKQLTTEVDQEQYNLIKKQLKRYPEVMKGIDAFVQAQSKIRLHARNAADWIKADNKLHETMLKTAMMAKHNIIGDVDNGFIGR